MHCRRGNKFFLAVETTFEVDVLGSVSEEMPMYKGMEAQNTSHVQQAVYCGEE